MLVSIATSVAWITIFILWIILPVSNLLLEIASIVAAVILVAMLIGSVFQSTEINYIYKEHIISISVTGWTLGRLAIGMRVYELNINKKTVAAHAVPTKRCAWNLEAYYQINLEGKINNIVVEAFIEMERGIFWRNHKEIKVAVDGVLLEPLARRPIKA